MTLKNQAERFLAGTETLDLELAGTEGVSVVTTDGRRYLDFQSGWCVGNFGWGQKHLRDAIRQHDGPDYVAPTFLYAPWVELARGLTGLAPGRLEVAYRATGGTEAVDIALQIAMAATGREGFIGIAEDYHGNSIGTVSVSDRAAREPYPNRLRGCRSLALPLNRRAADRLEKMLKRRDVAAVVMEPIVINLGVEVPEPEFMDRLAGLCRHYGTLLIADEVASGFGRTGTLFASEQYGLAPDLMCLGKAITGGYAPMGATLATRAIARKVRKHTSFYSTFGWHPLSTAVALANLRWLEDNRDRLLTHVEEESVHFRERLWHMGFEDVGVQGLAIGARARSTRAAQKIADACERKGLLVGAEDDIVMMCPPLVLSRADARRGLDILERAVKRAR